MMTLADAKQRLLDLFQTGMTEEELVQAEALLNFRLEKLDGEAAQIAHCEDAFTYLSAPRHERMIFSIGDADPSVLRDVPPNQWPGVLAGLEAARRR